MKSTPNMACLWKILGDSKSLFPLPSWSTQHQRRFGQSSISTQILCFWNLYATSYPPLFLPLPVWSIQTRRSTGSTQRRAPQSSFLPPNCMPMRRYGVHQWVSSTLPSSASKRPDNTRPGYPLLLFEHLGADQHSAQAGSSPRQRLCRWPHHFNFLPMISAYLSNRQDLFQVICTYVR